MALDSPDLAPADRNKIMWKWSDVIYNILKAAINFQKYL
jgi:hypothetical protein